MRVAEALWVAGAHDVVAVGREPDALASLGLATMPDERPGAGPAGRHRHGAGPGGWRRDRDRRRMRPAWRRRLPPWERRWRSLANDPTAGVAVPVSGGRTQWHHAAWRPSAGPLWSAALETGARAVGGVVAAAGLVVVGVDGIDPAALADADTPGDLPPGADGEGA